MRSTSRLSLFLAILLVFATCFADTASASSQKVRKSVLTGTWYKGTKATLEKQVDDFLFKVAPSSPGANRIRALIAPHAGYEWSGQTAAFAYKAIAGAPYKRVVILAPSHYAAFEGACLTDADAFETPLGLVSVDQDTCRALQQNALFRVMPEVQEQEHSLEIQLPFLQRTLASFTLVPVLVGELTPDSCKAIAEQIRPLLNADTLLVMSSDFTHQGPRFRYQPLKSDVKNSVRRMDFEAVNHLLNLDVRGFWQYTDAIHATICGRNPIKIGAFALPAQTQVEFVHYETSGDQLDDYSETVSYCALVLREKADYLDEHESTLALEIARKTLQQCFKENHASPYDLPASERTPHLEAAKGVFVTLQKEGQLRGCIGQMSATDPLYKVIAQTAILSAFNDTRFRPLQSDELEKLDLEISVLSPFQPIDSWNEIVLGRDGVLIEKNGRSAVFLPQVALEQGWTVEDTLTALCKKAGLKPDDWRSDCTLKTFTAQVFGESFKKLTHVDSGS